MEWGEARKRLNDLIDSEKVPIEEYQDKYYFLKKVKSNFPELPEERISSAINYANNEIKTKGKKRKYLNALSLKMFLA